MASRQDLRINRQVVRGEPQYIVHDPVAFANHALSAIEYEILCRISGKHTLGEAFSLLVDSGSLAADDAEEFYEFVLGLHGLALLVVPGMPARTVWRKAQDKAARRRRGALRMIVSARFSLGDPDRWLERSLPWVRWMFGIPGFAAWVALLSAALWQCGDRLGELYGDATDLLALHNLPVLWVVLVVMKVVHELGHAYAIKRFGGAVPDFGVLLMFLTPCAYVDANSSWTFRGRWQRIVVGLGGMYVETMVAFAFALVWAGTGPGLLHDVAKSIVVLATLTTVLINSNPLIKFDGYFVMSDVLGIFNLQERAQRHLRGVAERLFLGVPYSAEHRSRLEAVLAWCYAPASLVYRISLAIGITLITWSTWPLLGVPLGLGFLWLMILDPLRRMFRYLWNGERLESVRLRARVVAVLAVLGTVLALGLIPVSHNVVVPGVLDPGARRSVRAPSSAFVEEVVVRDGDAVIAGQALCRLRDPLLEERLVHIESELRAVRVEHDAVELVDPSLAATLAARMDYLGQRAAELGTRLDQLVVRPSEGGTVVGSRRTLPGSFARQGEELMQVHDQHRFVRVVLDEHQMARARLEIGTCARVRWMGAPQLDVEGIVCEVRRSASRAHVPIELTVAAGGEIQARSTGDAVEAEQPYLHVFLRVDDTPLGNAGSGMTARVEFGAREESLGGWLQRSFLSFMHRWRAN